MANFDDIFCVPNTETETALAKAYYQSAKELITSQSDSDKQLAATLFKKAAEKGHIKAEYELALCYRDGIGLDKNGELALMWLTEAADSGCGKKAIRAILEICKCWDEEHNSILHLPIYVYWLKRLAELGDTDAMYKLAEFYFDGDDRLLIEQDREMAKKLLTYAASEGHKEARYDLEHVLPAYGV